MKKIKLFLCVALFGAMSFGAFSAYEHYTMSEEERFLLANIEALTESEPGGGDISFNCSTYTSAVNNEYNYDPESGRNYLSLRGTIRDCNDGVVTWCYPGEIDEYFSPDGTRWKYMDHTSQSSCW